MARSGMMNAQVENDAMNEQAVATLTEMNGKAQSAREAAQSVSWSGCDGLVITEDARRGVARMALRNPERKQQKLAHYDAIYGPWAGLEELKLLELWSEGFIGEKMLKTPFAAGQIMELMSSVGPHATKRLGDRIPDQAIEEYRTLGGEPLYGVYFHNDQETASFVDYPNLDDQKNYIHYVLAPMAAIWMTSKLKTMLGDQSGEASPVARECCWDVLGTLKAHFAEYLHPQTSYNEAIMKWTEARGKVKIAEIMSMKK